jgi:lipopolysaccharide export system protein LptA
VAIAALVGAQNQDQSGNPGITPPQFDPKKPIHIVADRMEVDHAQQLVRFIGNVVAVQDDVVMNCDLLIVNYRPAATPTPARPHGPSATPAPARTPQPLVGLPEGGSEVDRLVAIGRVQMVQGNRRANCDRAEFDRRRGTLELTGNPEVAQGQDVLRGSRILIFTQTNRVDVVGQAAQRVQVTINPRSAQQTIEQQQQLQQQRRQQQQSTTPTPQPPSGQSTDEGGDEE